MKINFKHNEKKGITTCTIIEKGNKIYEGISRCHPDDKDMQNKLTGEQIAFYRAVIKHAKDNKRNSETSLKTLKHLYNTISQSKHHSKKSHETRMIKRQIYFYLDEINDYKNIIESLQEQLQLYIMEKENLYKKIRKNRLGKK